MVSEPLESKIERLITQVLRERLKLPLRNRPMPEEELVQIIVQKFGDGDISTTISAVIDRMEHSKYVLLRDLQGNLELNEK